MKQVDENNVQMGEFSAKDIAVAGYFSYMLGKNFVGGITAKFITSYIGDYNSIGMGVDRELTITTLIMNGRFLPSPRTWADS